MRIYNIISNHSAWLMVNGKILTDRNFYKFATASCLFCKRGTIIERRKTSLKNL